GWRRIREARLRPPQHERRVDPAEAERVGEHDVGRRRAALARQAIQVAGGVGALEVDGGWEPATVHRQGADRRLDGAARAEGVPVVTLGAADAETVGMREIGRHTSELQSPCNLVCRLLLEKKKKKNNE